MASRRDNQTTFFISAQMPEKNLENRLPAGLLATACVVISYHSRLSLLFGLFVPGMLFAGRAVFAQFKSTRVVLLVLVSGITSLLTGSTGEMNDYSVFTLFSHIS